jgi:small subunit ribosomal protein S13
MARIAGVDIPDRKRGEIALTYIFGIGRRSAQTILTKAEVDWNKVVSEWNDDEANAIRAIIAAEYRTTNEHQTFDGHWLLQRLET